jgi:hypothetical protein
MSYKSRYDKGDWIALCDVCGRKFKAHLLKKRWDGLMCCSADWEIRQPQDFVRGQADTQIAPWIRSEPANSFIPLTLTQWLVTYLTNSNASLRADKITHDYTNTKLVNGSALNNTTLG